MVAPQCGVAVKCSRDELEAATGQGRLSGSGPCGDALKGRGELNQPSKKIGGLFGSDRSGGAVA